MSRFLRETLASLSVSNEAVMYQDDHSLFHGLADRFRKIREENKKFTSDVVSKYGISELVKKHTGLNVEVFVKKMEVMNAWVEVPDINRNNAIYAVHYRDYFTNKDIDEAFKKTNKLQASVDLRAGKVSGWFSEIKTKIWLTDSLLYLKESDGSYWITEEEVAAIFLHECGHLMSFYESMTRVLSQNIIIESHLKAWKNAEDEKMRMNIVKRMQANDLLGEDFDGSLVKQVDDKTYNVVVSSSLKHVHQFDDRTTLYNMTQWESASDQYAVRMGAGYALASGLNKRVLHYYGSGSTRSVVYFLGVLMDVIAIAGTVGLLGIAGFAAFFPLFAVKLFVSQMKTFSTYDNDDDRIDRIYREIVGSLKRTDMPKEQVTQTLESLDRIKTFMEEQRSTFGDALTIFDAIYYGAGWLFEKLTFGAVKSRGNRHSVKSEQQKIEMLLNNDLYADSKRF